MDSWRILLEFMAVQSPHPGKAEFRPDHYGVVQTVLLSFRARSRPVFGDERREQFPGTVTPEKPDQVLRAPKGSPYRPGFSQYPIVPITRAK
jgi:hypothetical protein